MKPSKTKNRQQDQCPCLQINNPKKILESNGNIITIINIKDSLQELLLSKFLNDYSVFINIFLTLDEPDLFTRRSDEHGREIDDDGLVIVNGKVRNPVTSKNMEPNRNSLMLATEYQNHHFMKDKKKGKHPYRLTGILSIDDAKIKVSNNFSVTPITMTIAELSNRKRLKRSNVILVALAVSREKICYQQLFKCGFWDQFKKISNKELIMVDKLKQGQTDHTRPTFSFSFEILGLLADKPAMCKATMHTHHNGKFGCPHCSIVVKNLDPLIAANGRQIRGRTNVYNYTDELTPKENFELLSSKEGDERKGVNGNSILNKFLSLPDQAPIETMHLLYEGVTKKIIKFLVQDAKSRANMAAAALYLESIEVPVVVTRKPEGFKHLSQWKASSFKMFIFYYWPALRNNCDDRYFVLLAALSSIIRLLSSERFKLTQKTIESSRNLCDRFVYWYEKIFGEHNSVSNIHSLLHLPHQVERYGHLANCSSFVNEDFILTNLNAAYGSVAYAQQIYVSYLRNKSLKRILDRSKISEASEFEQFGARMLNPNTEIIGVSFSDVSAVGEINESTIGNAFQPFFTLNQGYDYTKDSNKDQKLYRKCLRIKFNDRVYHSVSYRKLGKKKVISNNSYMEYLDNNGIGQFAEIEFFICPPNNESTLPVLCIGRSYVCEKSSQLVDMKHLKIPTQMKYDFVNLITTVDSCFWRTYDNGSKVIFKANKIVNYAIKYKINMANVNECNIDLSDDDEDIIESKKRKKKGKSFTGECNKYGKYSNVPRSKGNSTANSQKSSSNFQNAENDGGKRANVDGGKGAKAGGGKGAKAGGGKGKSKSNAKCFISTSLDAVFEYS